MRSRALALWTAILVLGVCASCVAPRPKETAPPSPAVATKPLSWEEQALEDLHTPPDHPRRAMLVFPLVKAGSKDGTVGWGRGLLARQAMWRSSFAPDRLLDTCDSYMAALYVDQQLVGPGRKVTAKKIQNTCATFGCPNYATGTLAMDADSYKAVVTFHGEHGERTRTYSGPRDKFYMLPCLIARDVVDYLGVKLTPQQRAAIAEPPLTSTDQFDEIATYYHYMTENLFYYTGRSRLSLVGKGRTQWTEDFILWEPPYGSRTFERHMAELPGVKDRLIVRFLRALSVWQDADTLQGKASRIEPGKQPPSAEAVRTQWKKVATQMLPLIKEDPYNPWLLGMLTRALGGAGYERLHQAACDRYTLVFGDTALARMHRGTMLVDEAWDARGSGYADTVTQGGWRRYEKLLKEAATDLDTAAQMEPRAWPVQRERIWLATSMGRPLAAARSAWRAAMAACPTDYWACWNLIWYLQPRWYGSYQDAVGEARQIATGDAQACIPRLLARTYWILGQAPSKADRFGGVRSLLEQPDVAARVSAALERCVKANPRDYTSLTMLLAVGYWTRDRDRVLRYLKAIGRVEPPAWPDTLDEHYVTRYLYAEIIDWVDHPSSPPLLNAARAGRVGELGTLLAGGAEVNQKEADGATALVLAAHFGHPDAVRMLLEAGADPNARDDEGRTALHWATAHGWPEVSALLLKHKASPDLMDKNGRWPLRIATEYGFTDEVRALLAGGAAVNTMNEQKWTALAYAARDGRPQVAKLLLDAGADVSLPDKDGTPPLHKCAYSGSAGADVAAMLIARGANISARDRWQSTALHAAASQGNIRMARMLLDHGAELGARLSLGRTPLWMAASANQTEMIRFLAGKGADLNAGDKWDLTPLHACAMGNRIRGARTLLELGANPNALNNDKLTPGDLAAKKGYPELAALLRKAAQAHQPAAK